MGLRAVSGVFSSTVGENFRVFSQRCFFLVSPTSVGSGAGSGLSFSSGDLGSWADSGLDPGGNLYVIFILALSTDQSKGDHMWFKGRFEVFLVSSRDPAGSHYRTEEHRRPDVGL